MVHCKLPVPTLSVSIKNSCLLENTNIGGAISAETLIIFKFLLIDNYSFDQINRQNKLILISPTLNSFSKCHLFSLIRSASAHKSSCNPASHCSFPNHQTFYLLPKFGCTAHCCRGGGWRAQLSCRKVHAVTWDEPPGGAGMMGHVVSFHTFSVITWAMWFPHKREGSARADRQTTYLLYVQ